MTVSKQTKRNEHAASLTNCRRQPATCERKAGMIAEAQPAPRSPLSAARQDRLVDHRLRQRWKGGGRHDASGGAMHQVPQHPGAGLEVAVAARADTPDNGGTHCGSPPAITMPSEAVPLKATNGVWGAGASQGAKMNILFCSWPKAWYVFN